MFPFAAQRFIGGSHLNLYQSGLAAIRSQKILIEPAIDYHHRCNT